MMMGRVALQVDNAALLYIYWREAVPVVAIMELLSDLITLFLQLVSILVPFTPLTLLFLELADLVL